MFTAKQQQDELNVVHVTTTAKNPLGMERMAEKVYAYLRYNPFLAKNPNTSVWWKPIENL